MHELPDTLELLYLLIGAVFIGVVFIGIKLSGTVLRDMRGGPSDRITRREELFDMLDEQHEPMELHEKYSTSDPSFSFNGRDVVDDFAELRRRNAVHEKHLEGRVHLDL